MLKPTAQRAEQARQEAKDLFARDRAKELEAVKEREKAFAVQTQKTDRLRALRFVREAAERAAAEATPPATASTPKKARAPKAEE